MIPFVQISLMVLGFVVLYFSTRSAARHAAKSRFYELHREINAVKYEAERAEIRARVLDTVAFDLGRVTRRVEELEKAPRYLMEGPIEVVLKEPRSTMTPENLKEHGDKKKINRTRRGGQV